MNKEEALKELIYLSKIIERHNKLYYQNDSPEISDSEYDRLRARNADLEKKQISTYRQNGNIQIQKM